MRVLLFAQVVAVAFLLSGCPGAPASDPTGGGTCAPGGGCSTGGSGGAGGSGNSGVTASSTTGSGGSNSGGAGGKGGEAGSSTGGNGGTGGGDPLVCDGLLMDLIVAQQAAQGCLTEAPQENQCKQVIQGHCCAFSVSDANSPEVLAYLELLKAYQQMGCTASCPPEPCPSTDKPSCMPGTNGNGTCVP